MKQSETYLLLAGRLPLPWFLIWTTAGGLLLPNYSAIAQHGSELLSAGGASAFCLKTAAIGSGCAFAAFAAGLYSRSKQAIPVGALAWAVFGLSMISNGLWPMGHPMHGLHAMGIVSLVAPALSHIEVAEGLPLRHAYRVTAAVSIAGVIYLWLNLTGNDPQAFRGLTQRLFSSILSLWAFWASWALHRYRPRIEPA